MLLSKNALLLSAHADLVWRCGGAIAPHVDNSKGITLVCLAFVERGEATGREHINGQVHLCDYCIRGGRQRADQFKRISGGQSCGRDGQCAEQVQSIFPRTIDER